MFNNKRKCVNHKINIHTPIHLTHKLAFFRETNVTVFSHPEEGRFARQKWCKLKLCHLFICGLYFMYLYIILRQRIEDFICYKSDQWLNQSCDKKIRRDELNQLHLFASRSCRLQLPSITNTIWDRVILKIWKVI